MRARSREALRVLAAMGLAIALTVLRAGAQETTAPAPEAADDPAKITKVERQRPWTGLAIGAGWEKVYTTSGHVSNPFPFRMLFRTPARSGWGVSPMFGWFSSEVDAVKLSRPDLEMGELSVRPILIGVRRTWVLEEISVDAALAAGPSFNSFKVAEAIKPALALGTGAIDGDASISLAWRIQGSVWHDLTPKIAVRGHLAYTHNQPEITFRAGANARRINENANAVMLGFGLVYRIF